MSKHLGTNHVPLEDNGALHTVFINCDQCDEEFPSPIALSKHTNEVHLKMKCPQCKFVADSQDIMEMHTKSRHQLKCDQCDANFTCENDLKAHKLEHHQVNSLNCANCDFTTNMQTVLETHTDVVHSSKSKVKFLPY